MWAEPEKEKEPRNEEECVFELGTSKVCVLTHSGVTLCDKDTCPFWRIMKLLSFIVFPFSPPPRREMGKPLGRHLPR